MSDLKQRILAAVAPDFEEIETALHENLTPYLDLVKETAIHILFSGGKRLRPLLMVMAARVCGNTEKTNFRYSTIFEYLHAATLLHDDLVDDASIRRGNPVAHSVYGNATAVLTGDFLLARGLSIAADTGNLDVIRVIASITENMSQGEIHQLYRKGCLDLAEAEYMEVIKRKTAVLIEGACRVGALVAGAPKEAEEALAQYGYHLGIAFQMADDLLDYTADTRVLGKAVGTDLREGKLTLPVIHSLKAADAETRKMMERLIKDPDFSESDFQQLVEMLHTFGGIAYTREKAIEFVEKAKSVLSVLPASKTLEVMALVADYAIERQL